MINNITRHNHNNYEHNVIKKVNKHIKHINSYCRLRTWRKVNQDINHVVKVNKHIKQVIQNGKVNKHISRLIKRIL